MLDRQENRTVNERGLTAVRRLFVLVPLTAGAWVFAPRLVALIVTAAIIAITAYTLGLAARAVEIERGR